MPGLYHDRDSLQCSKGVACEIAPGIGSDSHPLGVLAVSNQDLDRYPSIG